MNRIPAVLLLLGGTLACAIRTTGPAFQSAPGPPTGQALVYLMRTRIESGNMWETTFSIDGRKAVSLYDKGYSWVHLPAGDCKFDAEIAPGIHQGLYVDLAPGKTYYLQVTQDGYKRILRQIYGPLALDEISGHQYKPANF